MYCLVSDLQRLLPEKVTIGDTNIGVPVPGRESADRSNFTTAESKQFIQYSQEYIDGILRPIYVTPLRQTKAFETVITADVLAGSSVTVTVRDARVFSVGEVVRLQNSGDMETAEITDVSDTVTFTVDTVVGNYYTANSDQVSILEFPDPIKVTTARFAVSFMLDKLWAAEQEPDVSNYGKSQRNMGRDAIESILAGEIKLFGQEHTGRRFIRGSLIDAYGTPNFDFQKNADNE